MRHQHDDWHWIWLLRRILCREPGREVVRVMTYEFNRVSFTAKGDDMGLTVTTDDVPGTATFAVAFKTPAGKPAKVDGVPVWTASNSNVIDSISPNADGLGGTFHILANPDASLLNCEADVDVGEGVKTTTFTDTVSVIPAEAASAEFTFGTVTPD